MRITTLATTPEPVFEIDYEALVGLYAVGLVRPGGTGPVANVSLNGVTLLNLADDTAERRQSNTFVGKEGDVVTYTGPAGVELYLVRLGDELTTEE